MRGDALCRRIDERAAVPVRRRVLAQFVLWNFVDFFVFVLGPAVIFLKMKVEYKIAITAFVRKKPELPKSWLNRKHLIIVCFFRSIS